MCRGHKDIVWGTQYRIYQQSENQPFISLKSTTREEKKKRLCEVHLQIEFSYHNINMYPTQYTVVIV